MTRNGDAGGAAAPGRYVETMTWLEVEAALQEDPPPTVMLPLGARAKEHGPHLPLGNDGILCDQLTRRVVARAPVLALPVLGYGFYPAFLEYPGSTHLTRETATACVCDIARSFARHGVAKLYVLNTGISTNWALEPARKRLLEEDGFALAYTDLTEAAKEVREHVRDSEGGTHADEIETSMMLHLAPEIVRLDAIARDYHPSRGPGGLTRDADATTGVYSPSGVWGDPTRATAEKGRLVVEALVDAIVEEIGALRDPGYVPPPWRERYLATRRG